MISHIIHEESEEERKKRVGADIVCVICKQERPEEEFNHNTDDGTGVCERCQENGR